MYSRNSRSRTWVRETSNKVLAGIVVVALVIGTLFIGAAYYEEDTHTGCVVTEKDRTRVTDSNGNSSSDARVYTENCGVFVVSDTIIKGKFNSADTFGGIQVGTAYDFTTIGWRFGVLSMFPNIIEYKVS